jgi:hypothetical protein
MAVPLCHIQHLTLQLMSTYLRNNQRVTQPKGPVTTRTEPSWPTDPNVRVTSNNHYSCPVQPHTWQYALITIRTALESDINVRILHKGTAADCHDRATPSLCLSYTHTHTRNNNLLRTHLCQLRAHKHHKRYGSARPTSSVAGELHTALLADRYAAVPQCVRLPLRLSRHWRTTATPVIATPNLSLLQESGVHYWPNALSRLMLLCFVK